MPCSMRLDYLYQIIKQEAQQKSKIKISNFFAKSTKLHLKFAPF